MVGPGIRPYHPVGLAAGEGRQDVHDVASCQDGGAVPDGDLVQQEAAPGQDPFQRRCPGRRLRTFDVEHGGQQGLHRGSGGKLEVLFIHACRGPCGSEVAYVQGLASDGTHAAVRLDEVRSVESHVVHAVGFGLQPHGILPAFGELLVARPLPQQAEQVEFLA